MNIEVTLIYLQLHIYFLISTYVYCSVVASITSVYLSSAQTLIVPIYEFSITMWTFFTCLKNDVSLLKVNGQTKSNVRYIMSSWCQTLIWGVIIVKNYCLFCECQRVSISNYYFVNVAKYTK